MILQIDIELTEVNERKFELLHQYILKSFRPKHIRTRRIEVQKGNS